MTKYIFTYDADSSRDSMIHAALKQLGLTHIQNSVWLFESEETPNQIMGNFQQWFDRNDRLFVAALENIPYKNINPIDRE